MNEETRIEQVPLLPPEPPVVKAPDMTPKKAVLPQSVINAVKMRHEQLAEAELNGLQRLYREGELDAEQITLLVQSGIIQEPKNIFQLLQEKSMNAIFAFVLSWIKNNWRTTYAGIVVFAATTLAKAGINLNQHELDALMGIGYAVIFKFSDVRWDLSTIVGVALMVLSFFINPVLAGLGVTVDMGVLLFIQQLLQQGVATLLKDQKQLFTQPVPQQ
jgi:hypothetical protein